MFWDKYIPDSAWDIIIQKKYLSNLTYCLLLLPEILSPTESWEGGNLLILQNQIKMNFLWTAFSNFGNSHCLLRGTVPWVLLS